MRDWVVCALLLLMGICVRLGRLLLFLVSCLLFRRSQDPEHSKISGKICQRLNCLLISLFYCTKNHLSTLLSSPCLFSRACCLCCFCFVVVVVVVVLSSVLWCFVRLFPCPPEIPRVPTWGDDAEPDVIQHLTTFRLLTFKFSMNSIVLIVQCPLLSTTPTIPIPKHPRYTT